jgi:uncharacterized protein YuzE
MSDYAFTDYFENEVLRKRPYLEMKLNYYKETDSLYIDLSSRPSAESREVSDGIVLDYDADGNITGIDIDNASSKIDLKRVVLSKIPAEVEELTA